VIDTDEYEDDEGWMWLDWETLQEHQRELNKMYSRLLDNVNLAQKNPDA
jgi:hypothetical protein